MNIQNLYITATSFCISHIPLTRTLRDTLIWPIASRVLGTDYNHPMALKAGFSLNTFMEDQLGRFALFYGARERYFWEPTTMQLMERLVVHAHDVIIAGSHIGLTALYARRAMEDKTARVHTFEPIAHLFDVSQKNFDLNTDLGTVILTKKALGDVRGEVLMTQDRIRSRIVQNGVMKADLETESVPVTTISDYCKEAGIATLDFVLLDVEGYEYHALRGMESILESAPPRDIVYEISFPAKDNLETAHTIESYLAPFGYTCYIIEEAHDPLESTHTQAPLLTRTSDMVYENHRDRRYFNVYATRRSAAEVRTLLA